MDRNEIIEIIEEYILENVDENDIDYDYDFFDAELVNSLFTIELMTFIERNFNVKILMEELDINNFNTINHIVEFVHNKLKRKEGGR